MLRILRKYTGTIIIVISLLILFLWWQNARAFDDQAMEDIPVYDDVELESFLMSESLLSMLEPMFLQYYDAKRAQGVVDTTGIYIEIPGVAFSAVSDFGVSLQDDIGGREGPFLVMDEEDSWVEYVVDIPEDGFYQFQLNYYAMEGKRSSVLRSIQIDGAYPFMQAKRLELFRMWREAGPVWMDSHNNEFNPRQEEVLGWQTSEVRDADARVAEALRFHLTAGEHTIRINTLREPAAIGEFIIHSPLQLPTYEQRLAEYETNGYEQVQGHMLKIQAEEADLKSSPTLRRIESRDPSSEPFNQYGVGLNTIGGYSWRNGGEWIEWHVDIPESGLYEIAFKTGSWYLDGIPVQRILRINGEIPFQEMNEINFPYGTRWDISVMGGQDDPYLFYLEEGTNKLRLEVQVGALGEVFEKVNLVSQSMSFLSREVILYTGTNPDPNRTWELDKAIPNLIPRLHTMARELDEGIRAMYELGVEKGSSRISPLGMARDQLLHMANDPDSIPNRMTQMSETQSSLGLWITGLSEQSLSLDYLLVQAPGNDWPRPNARWYEKTFVTIYDFFLSFFKNYEGVGDQFTDEKTLDVWVLRGRDWVEIVKQLADEDFTPVTGIKVNVNVIPAGDLQKLLLSTTTGLEPDVALGVDAEIPIDLAIRNALVDLSTFDNYDEVVERFRPGALIPYQYNNGAYALPETQNFNMLFYRKDIMDQLGVTHIPDTWEEVMDLIPLLQQVGMDFYYPHAPNNPQLAINEFSPFLFQHGGEFYRHNGIVSDLDSPEALAAMKMWTGLFTNYKISKDASFYNRFRTGEMPIGVADYTTYVLLSTAAPELTGWWGMKPMPGMRQDDGTINRSTGGLAQTSIIFANSDLIDESWSFIQWWTSADVQEQFGIELESLLGVEARWNTSNVEALQRLPWPSEDIASILEQWDWFKEREIVLGGYYTTRHVANMWNEIVLNGMNHREAIEDGLLEINKELRKKREEFGLDVEIGPVANVEGGTER